MLRGLSRLVTVQVALVETLESRLHLSATPVGLQPAQVRHAYGFDLVSFTNSLGKSIKGDGAGQTIAIVNAFDNPNIAADLNSFDRAFSISGGSQTLYTQYGAASSFFTKKLVASATPADPGWLWALESAMDVQWAHAIAPRAKIVLVEAASDSLANLLAAVDLARNTPGVSVVSTSWGTPEFAGQTSYDGYFTTPAGHAGVSFVASSGDNGGGALWPSVSPNVISVGGTSLTLGAGNSYQSESAWSGSGGSISLYEAKPSYQGSVALSLGSRSAPDVAYLADPYTGVAVYDSYKNNAWIEVGGTSAGAPQWAGLLAIANQARAAAGKPTLDGRAQALPALYGTPSANYHDILSGSNTFSAGPGYDLVTGMGSPVANRLILALQSASSTGAVAQNQVNPAGTQTLRAAVRAHSQIALTNSASTPALPALPAPAAAPSHSHAPSSGEWPLNIREDVLAALTQKSDAPAKNLTALLEPRPWNLFSSIPLLAA